jgi:hypothetical protein
VAALLGGAILAFALYSGPIEAYATGPVDHITITPATTTVGPDLTVTYATEAFDQYGNDLGDVTAATSFSISPDGTCSGRYCFATVSGGHTVTATYQLAMATASMTVTLGTPTFLAMSPSSSSISAGGSQTYTVQGYDQYRNPFGDVTSVTSFALDGNACPGNTCSSTLAGQHQVAAQWRGVSASASLMVTAGPLARLTVLPATAVIDFGQTLNYSASAWDAYGNAVVYTVPQITWSISVGTPGTISSLGGNAAFTASSTATGTGSVIATVGNVTGSSPISVRPTAPAKLTAAMGGKKINLSWASSPSNKIFRVYRTTGGGAAVVIATGLTSTAFGDVNVVSGVTYGYFVTALGTAGVESAASNTVSVTII